MRNQPSLVTALGLVILWAAMLFLVPTFMSQFAGFKVEMPALTFFILSVFRFMGGIGLPLLVLLTAVLLSYRQVPGWLFAIALCVVCDLAFLGLLLPYISLMNNLSGGATPTPAPPTPSSFGSFPALLFVGAFLLNQVLFIWLLIKRRDFVGYNQPNANGKISYT